MSKKNQIFVLTILIELAVIGFLGFRIYEKKQKVLSAVSVNPINKSDLTFPEEVELKNFYEYSPNETIKQHPVWLSYEATYTINSDGLNERFDYDIKKPSGTFRIITIGDSFTFGHYVNTKDNYPEQLEDLLNKTVKCSGVEKFEVINLGVMGYDIQMAVRRLKIRGQKYNPDLVLWFLKDDDFLQIWELIAQRVGEESSKSADLNSDPKKMYLPYDIATRELIEKYGEDNILDQQSQFMAEISEFYQDSLFLFTYQDQKEKYKDRMRNFVKSRPNTYFFDKISYEFPLPDGHPSAKGYTVLVDNLLKGLIENKVIPCY